MGNTPSQAERTAVSAITPSSYAGQKQVWEPGFNTTVPEPSKPPMTLSSGAFWGSSALGSGRLTSIQHPSVGAQMGAITGNIGGGRLNPYGGGGIIEDLPRLEYTPTNQMPMPSRNGTIVQPIMGGQIAGQGQMISSTGIIRWDAKQEPIKTANTYMR